MNKQAIQIALILAIFCFLFIAIFACWLNLPLLTSILIALVFALIIGISSKILIEKFVYNKLKTIFDKVLKINLDHSTNETFADLDVKIEKYIEAKSKADEELINHQNFRKEYIGNIAHELKTPIFNIQGYILTLLDGGLEDENINRNYLERASNSVDRIINIIDDLDLITRLDSGDIPLNIKTFDFVLLLKELYNSMEFLAKENSIHLQIKLDYKKPLLVLGDKDKLFQVLMNLCTNAIKYGNVGGKVELSISEFPNKYLIEIKDNGVGISEENLPRIFERFYRVDKSRGRKIGGSGLGLSIVKHIIEAHQETINVASKLNEGTSFTFTVKKA